MKQEHPSVDSGNVIYNEKQSLKMIFQNKKWAKNDWNLKRGGERESERARKKVVKWIELKKGGVIQFNWIEIVLV